jgi:hypothetical protein
MWIAVPLRGDSNWNAPNRRKPKHLQSSKYLVLDSIDAGPLLSNRDLMLASGFFPVLKGVNPRPGYRDIS